MRSGRAGPGFTIGTARCRVKSHEFMHLSRASYRPARGLAISPERRVARLSQGGSWGACASLGSFVSLREGTVGDQHLTVPESYRGRAVGRLQRAVPPRGISLCNALQIRRMYFIPYSL